MQGKQKQERLSVISHCRDHIVFLCNIILYSFFSQNSWEECTETWFPLVKNINSVCKFTIEFSNFFFSIGKTLEQYLFHTCNFFKGMNYIFGYYCVDHRLFSDRDVFIGNLFTKASINIQIPSSDKNS